MLQIIRQCLLKHKLFDQMKNKSLKVFGQQVIISPPLQDQAIKLDPNYLLHEKAAFYGSNFHSNSDQHGGAICRNTSKNSQT